MSVIRAHEITRLLKAAPCPRPEIVLGTVTNVREAVQWLSYTYMYCRMVKNPLVYGLTFQVRVHGS